MKRQSFKDIKMEVVSAKIGALALSIIGISVFHFVLSVDTHSDHLLHIFLRTLYLIPIIAAALWFRLKGALIVSFIIVAVYFAHMLTTWAGRPMENANQIAMIAMYLLVGLTSGGLASLEARQRQAKEEAERIMREEMVSRRIAEQKDAFIRIASHDLKNPLLGIYGSARVLEKILEPGGVIEDDAYDLLTRISKNALLMQHIIEDFLDFHALEDGEITITRKPADLNTIAQNAVDHNVDYAAQKGSKILTDLTDSPPLVEADEKRIEQVVLNLLSNAIKFSPKGAKVVVRTRQKEAAVVLEIQDNGPGLTEEDKENLFKKYARLSNKPTGGEKSSGLGLSICKQLVDLHGGDIGAENNSDGGATFWIELSATETHEERS